MPPKREKIYVFLDTNLHLHFQEFDQVDWLKYLRCKSVCLVFAPITVSELEKFKYDRDSQRKQQRARMITKKINEMILAAEPGIEVPVKGRKGVNALMLIDSPDTSVYPGLQQSVGDDELVASILKFTSDHPGIDRNNIILVSDDGGVLNKARARGINFLLMDESFRLPDGPTIEQEKITRLERRIKEFEDRQPQLGLAFIVDGVSVEHVHFNLETTPHLDMQNLVNLVETESKAISWAPAKPTPPRVASTQQSNGEHSTIIDAVNAASATMAELSALNSLRGEIPKSEIDRYQEDTETYLRQYQNYLQENHAFKRFNQLSRSLVFQVTNVGNGPATGVVIRVIFPEELDVFDWDEFPEQPEKPDRPVKPRNQMDMILDQRSITLPAFSRYTDFIPPIDTIHPNPDTAGPKITRNSPAVVEWSRSKVMHHIPLALTTLGVVFPARPGDIDYFIDYKIYADNLSVPVESKLQISVHTEITK